MTTLQILKVTMKYAFYYLTDSGLFWFDFCCINTLVTCVYFQSFFNIPDPVSELETSHSRNVNHKHALAEEQNLNKSNTDDDVSFINLIVYNIDVEEILDK